MIVWRARARVCVCVCVRVFACTSNDFVLPPISVKVLNQLPRTVREGECVRLSEIERDYCE